MTLFEVFTDGRTPYASYKTNHEVWMKVNKGERLAKPRTCPDDIWLKMFLPCWGKNYKKRPSFQDILNYIEPRLKLERLGTGMDSDAGSDAGSVMGGSDTGSQTLDTNGDGVGMSRANSSMSSTGLADFDPAWFQLGVNAPKESSNMFELEMLA